jgi:DNA-binding MarR family transcriptional regulator
MSVASKNTDNVAASLAKVDNLLLHRTRLGICALLAAANVPIKFADFKKLLDESDGNLGAHIRKLEDAGYLVQTKSFIDRKPVSHSSLTKVGKAALSAHLAAMEALHKAVK